MRLKELLLPFLDRVISIDEVRDQTHPVPDEATVLGTLPEELQPLFAASCQAKRSMDEISEYIDLRAKGQALDTTLIEATNRTSDYHVLIVIFTYEVLRHFEQFHGGIGITDSWQVWWMESDHCPCGYCETKRQLARPAIPVVFLGTSPHRKVH